MIAVRNQELDPVIGPLALNWLFGGLQSSFASSVLECSLPARPRAIRNPLKTVVVNS